MFTRFRAAAVSRDELQRDHAWLCVAGQRPPAVLVAAATAAVAAAAAVASR